MHWLPKTLFATTILGVIACGDDTDPPTGGSPPEEGGGGTGPQGGGGEGTGGGGAPPGECPTLTPLDTMMFIESYASFGLSARVELPLAGYDKTRLTMELYELDGVPIAEGDFDLSITPDDSYATCQHCVLLVAYDEAGMPRRAFFQDRGSMTLSSYDPQEPWFAAGSVEGVRVIEVTQNPDSSWTVVPDGLCFEVEDWSFDTRLVDGGACERAEDCPNELFQVCDVETRTCQPAECDLFGDFALCDEGYRCMSQYGTLIDRTEVGPAIGACYPTCTPTMAGSPADCGGDETCFALDATQEFGICLAKGEGSIGASCDVPDVGTGCAQGGLCTGEPPICRQICDYLSADIQCPADTYCSSLNLCEPLDIGDIAPVGALCEPGAPTLMDCGPEGEAFRGVCFRTFETELDATCVRTCETAAPSCPSGTACLAVFTNPNVGICYEPGACGDGDIDLLVGEVCDDGNVQSGDGCSADCRTPELEPLCSAAEPLPVDSAVVETTEGGPTGYASLCDPFIATPVKTFEFMPPAPGELVLNLQSAVSLGVSVLGDCADGASELDCRLHDDDSPLYVNFPEVPAQPALIVVRGATPFDEGLFILEAAFTEAVCGDLQVGGPEACDDGNTTGADGCSADCSIVEWNALCASLPILESGDEVTGDLDAGSQVFDLSLSCSYESGRERAYAFTAPADGTLAVSVSAAADLVLFVRDACGPIDDASYLTCANSAWPGETESANVTLAAGQTVTVIVDGFTREDAGPFELSADFAAE